jgi:hypothetical protein
VAQAINSILPSAVAARALGETYVGHSIALMFGKIGRLLEEAVLLAFSFAMIATVALPINAAANLAFRRVSMGFTAC